MALKLSPTILNDAQEITGPIRTAKLIFGKFQGQGTSLFMESEH